MPIDILYGSSRLRTHIDNGGTAKTLMDTAREDEERFLETRKPFLLY